MPSTAPDVMARLSMPLSASLAETGDVAASPVVVSTAGPQLTVGGQPMQRNPSASGASAGEQTQS